MKYIQLTNNSQSVSFTKTRIPGRLKRDLLLIGMGLIEISNFISTPSHFAEIALDVLLEDCLSYTQENRSF